MRIRSFAVALTWALACGAASGESFGVQVVVGNIKVQSIYRGAYGPTYVTFTPSLLAGCNGNYGGYLSSTWPEAISWTPDSLAARDQLAILLAAKATSATVEVRFRVNSQGTGWDKCAIDAVWIQ